MTPPWSPEELESYGGAITNHSGGLHHRPSLYWLHRIADRFHACWLNPLSKDLWKDTYGYYTLNQIRGIFHMEDMTLGGIKGMGEFLSEK